MKFYKIICSDSKRSLALKKELIKILSKHQWVNNENEHEYIFVIGGDGTFLKSIDYFNDKKVIMINGGNFGYYSYFDCSNLKSLIDEVIQEKNYNNLLLLELTINNQKYYALNEIHFISFKTMITEIKIDNEKLETFKGSGIILSTPMGSTAHSKNAGGSIISRHLNVFQLLEVHPISQKGYSTLKSPLILDDESIVKITNKNNFENASIVIDGKIIDQKLINFATVKAVKSKFNYFCKNNKKMYIKKLKYSFVKEETNEK